LRACRRFPFLSLRHVQGPNTGPQRVGWRYHSTPSALSYQRRRCFGIPIFNKR
jgi:hypothetical protein